MKNWKINLKIIFILFAFLYSASSFGQDATDKTMTETPMDLSFLPYVLMTIAALLLVTILVVVSVLKGLSNGVIKATKKNAMALVGFLMLGSQLLLAAEPAAKQQELPSIMLYTFLISVITIEILILFYLLKNVRIFLNILSPEVKSESVVTESGINWDKIWQRLNGLKPIEQEADLRMHDHVYDGNIVELDNRMPPWLFFMFNATVLFAFVYIYLYHFSSWGPDPKREYATAMNEAAVVKAAFLDKQANTIDENTVALLTDAASLQAGAAIYKTNCVACHGDKGQGGVGPNFADDYWIHGGSMPAMYKVIVYGVEAKGMKSWKNDLMPADIQKVASYIKSMRGTNPPGGKAPQGDLYTEEAAGAVPASVPAKDTSATKSK
ncbi:MAG: c-type cytochrome [Saprospiraceae bacterium]